MKSFSLPAAMLLTALSAGPALAQITWCSPVYHRPLGRAPDMCGPGYYAYNGCNTIYGPNYCVRPPFPPVQGIGPGCHWKHYVIPPRPLYHPHSTPGSTTKPSVPYAYSPPMVMAIRQPGLPPIASLPHLPLIRPPQLATFPSHPFSRSPRDFFMWGEAMADEQSRLRHPALIP